MDKKKFMLRYTLLYALCLAVSVGLGLVLTLVLLESRLLEKLWIVLAAIVAASLGGGYWLAWLIRRRTLKKLEKEGSESK